jgi:outer membrane protein assembly factor BamB
MGVRVISFIQLRGRRLRLGAPSVFEVPLVSRKIKRVRARGWPALAAFFALVVGLGAQTEGTRRWAFNVQGYITLSSPALSADGATVYVGVERAAGGRVVAVSAEGVRKWDVAMTAPVDSSPVVGADGTIYIGCVDGRLYALNPANGATKWTFNARGFITSSPAVGADGTLYFGSGAGRLFAVTPEGVERWSFGAGGIIDSSPAIAADGSVYFGCDDKSFYAVSPAGIELWRFSTGGPIFSSPAIGADGSVYFGSGDQKMYALSADGALRWAFSTNGAIQASPSLGADGTVYFASADGFFYALNAKGSDDQRVKWKTTIRASAASSAAVRGDGVIIFGADDDLVRALNPEDGSVRWTLATLDDIESSPIVAPDGSIYIGSFDGLLYKITGNGSPLSAYSNWPAFRRGAGRGGRALAKTGEGRLVNLSARAQLGDREILIVGFFVQGPGVNARTYLLRGIGPALGQFGVVGMADPRLQIYSGPVILAGNDNWGNALPSFGVADTAAAVGAFPLSEGSKDAAIVLALPVGLYSSHLSSTDARGGVVLMEVYDAIGGDPALRLANLSMRAQVGVDANALFAGLVVGGTSPSRLLLRGIGPSLTQFGVPGVLARPALALFNGTVDGALIGSNTGWTTAGFKRDLEIAARAVAAFPLADGSNDSALVVTVEPGPYTIKVSGVGNTTGEALVEIYILP